MCVLPSCLVPNYLNYNKIILSTKKLLVAKFNLVIEHLAQITSISPAHKGGCEINFQVGNMHVCVVFECMSSPSYEES